MCSINSKKNQRMREGIAIELIHKVTCLTL